MSQSQLAPLRIEGEERTLSKGQKTFNKHMQEIEKLRARLAAWETAAAGYQDKYTRELLPLFERAVTLESELAHALDRAAQHKGLTLGERRMLSDLIVDLAGGLLAERDDADLKALYNRHSPSDYDSEEAGHLQDMKDVLEEMFGIDLGAADEIASPDELARRVHEHLHAQAQRRAAQPQEPAAARPGRKKSMRQIEKEAEKQAQADAEAQRIKLSIRDIYRKLASALHPDRESDPQERERKTALMQRINQAYDKRDLLQLLELQLELEHIDRTAITRLDDERLRHYNAVLKEQIGELKAEVWRVEMDFRGRFGIDPFTSLKPETGLRNLVRNIAEATRGNRALERDVHACADTKSTKAWLKELRRRARESKDEDDFLRF